MKGLMILAERSAKEASLNSRKKSLGVAQKPHAGNH